MCLLFGDGRTEGLISEYMDDDWSASTYHRYSTYVNTYHTYATRIMYSKYLSYSIEPPKLLSSSSDQLAN